MAAPPLITLLTDFGNQDTYVGQMRGVIAGIVRAANVVDLTHAIAPQDVLQGAIVWADAVAAFPPGTIHVGVVDRAWEPIAAPSPRRSDRGGSSRRTTAC